MDARQIFCLKILLYYQKNRNKLQRLEHIHNTRNKEKTYNLPKRDKTIGQRCFDYLGPKLFNQIPIYLQNIQKLSYFKAKIKIWMKSKNRDFFHKIVNNI